MRILVLNAGSSSQKSRLYEIEGTISDIAPAPLWQADADWSHHPGATDLKITTSGGVKKEESLPTDERAAVIERMLQSLWSGETRVIDQLTAIDIVGHRVVHGGIEFEDSVFVTPQVKATIRKLAVLAPEHNPANLEGIEAIERLAPAMPQVAVFDTAFHRSMPDEVIVYPLPYGWYKKEGIRRFGFHGISHCYCARRAAHILGKDLSSLRLITCHLGNGCSLAAIRGGRSIDTSMGFTPLEGVTMGSRSGSIDPGILFYMQREKSYTSSQLNTILNKASGLKGIAGSSDMRQVLQKMYEGDALSRLAFEIFTHRLRSSIGAMMASLGGLDALVFAGGIGENAAEVRTAACKAFGFLGLELDEQKNARSPADADVAAVDSQIRVLIVQTQEDWAIAQDCWKLARANHS
ncbi:MAG TPA: acetate kinase [Ktedonobacteraceae bacterium]